METKIKMYFDEFIRVDFINVNQNNLINSINFNCNFK